MSRLKSIFARSKLFFQKKNCKPIEISIPSDLNKPANVLVCLPSKQRELTIIRQLLPDIASAFSDSEIYLLASPGSSVYDIFPRKGYRIMTPTSQHLTWSGLPKKAYMASLAQRKIDIIFDLNLYTNYFAQYILLSFPKAIRIGKGNHLGSPFYNLEVKTRFLRDEKNIFKSIITTVDRLRHPPKPIVMDGTAE